ncbi:hypothetical protein GCM10010911_17560 [Paenibacillus nasutitermitis]|uniref:Uncharacterized protein n=1 Tax=Paenibacillus nasutitermitis TaxID=1652958 RepID=A0A916YSY9_9BACL|nr:hypothetical protein GCM10010911_17560 [Paenibacillus nasutitermitis]
MELTVRYTEYVAAGLTNVMHSLNPRKIMMANERESSARRGWYGKRSLKRKDTGTLSFKIRK